jgi:hypothetical protein
MFDFVSIIYYKKSEIELLKIQLFSFMFVDINIINNIYILFNDSNDKNELFRTEYLTCIYKYVPTKLIDKIKIIYITDLISLNEPYKTNWYTQQFAKIYISKIINSKYYVMLDSKNIFIKNIDLSYFILNNKIKMYYSNHNDDLMKFYNNCFNYFGITNISKSNPYNHPLYIQTTTPFVFITKECKHMIDFIENKENTNLYNFFCRHQHTEFFLYFAWLCFTNNTNNYIFVNEPINNPIIGPHDPNIYTWNNWDSKMNHLNKYKCRVLSISSKCTKFIDNSYKNNIKKFINDVFKNEMINDTIENMLQS